MSGTDDELDLDDFEPREGESESDLVKRLRSSLKNQGKELKELRPLKDKVAEIELGNSLSKAFDKDELGSLSERKRIALLASAGDDKSPEGLRKAAEELGFVEAKIDPLDEELAGHERTENAGTGAAAGAATKIDAVVVATWPMDKQLRFRKEHPAAWEQLKRGEAVTGITF